MTPLILPLIDAATARDPDRTAVICGDERLSWWSRARLARIDLATRD